MDRLAPDFAIETAAQRAGHRVIAGVDEVGRGPLCGPVTAAAVVLDPENIPPGLADSKRLGPARRIALAEQIARVAQVSIAHASVEEIDRLNILHAAMLAMRRAVEGLPTPPDIALIDGNRVPPGLPCTAQAVVKGDAKVLSIAAASIVAKVARDTIMVDLAQQFPAYGWDRNAGYPTRDHLQALLDFGVTPWHRRSFRPVHNILYQGKTISP